MIEVRNPANQFFDKNGDPLDAGYIYIGATGVNPEVTAQAVYWDKDGLIPAAQPIRTINGYPSRDGAASKFYTATKNYSITVRNKKGELVISTLNCDSGIFDELAATTGAAGIGINGPYWLGSGADNVEEALQIINDYMYVLGVEVSTGLSVPPAINLFANSAFVINQRGYASSTPTVAANQYTLDRIRVVVSGQSIAFGPSTFGNLITCPAGGAEQVIEGARITGGQYACNWGGSGTITVNGLSRSKGEEFTLAANTNATVRMFGQFERFVLTRPKMIGVVSDNKFEYDINQDYALCRRYYEAGEYAEFSGNVTSGSAYYARVSFKTRKRTATPTITLSNAGATGFPAAGGVPSLVGADGFTEGRTANGTGVGRFYSTWTADSEI